jgi:hypothetical protein
MFNGSKNTYNKCAIIQIFKMQTLKVPLIWKKFAPPIYKCYENCERIFVGCQQISHHLYLATLSSSRNMPIKVTCRMLVGVHGATHLTYWSYTGHWRSHMFTFSPTGSIDFCTTKKHLDAVIIKHYYTLIMKTKTEEIKPKLFENHIYK